MNQKCLRTLGLLALLGTLLMDCSGQPTLAPQPSLQLLSWEQRQQQLSPLSRWEVLGKIRIQSATDDNSANLNWEQHNDQYQIYMAGPLGQGAVNIQGSELTGITLEISGQERMHSTSPEQLLYQQLGWETPISQIPFWIKGMPAPKTRHTKTLDSDSKLQQLQQSGWTIDYLSYHLDQQPQLPRKIRLQRGDSLTLTLILKQWNLDSSTTPP